MGYMGFGMRKEAYTRKPRKAFKHLKRLLETELYNKTNSGRVDHQRLTKDQINQAKEKIRTDIIRQKKRELIVTIFSILISLVAILLLLIWIDII
jgi:hypothetical protein